MSANQKPVAQVNPGTRDWETIEKHIDERVARFRAQLEHIDCEARNSDVLRGRISELLEVRKLGKPDERSPPGRFQPLFPHIPDPSIED